MNNIILGQGLTKEYGYKTKYTVLDKVTIPIKAGEFMCIMGPSGAGKSTLLNLVSTVDVPSRGLVFILKKKLISLSNRELSRMRYENISYIFQEFNLLENLTARENIGLPLSLGGVKKSEIKKRVNEIAERLNITAILDKRPGECSGGQRQRVACGRALITKPKILIADEPTGNLDSRNSHELMQLLKELNENDNITIVMVTHDSMIASYSEKVVMVQDGNILSTIEKRDSGQKEYFYKILDMNSKEALMAFDR